MAAKRTWRRRTIADDAIRDALRQSDSIAAAARQLGVNKSTLSRWVRAEPGLHPSPAVSTPAHEVPAAVQPAEAQTPESWKAWVLATFDASPTERVLLDLAVEALDMSRDLLLRPADRLAAAARFQSLIRQLNFPDPEAVNEAQTPARPNLYSVK
jgi:transposase-like protein